LKGTDSALKTKTKDFVIVPHTLDVAQLSKILERHDSVIVEKRSEDKSKIENLWVATAANLFKLIQWLIMQFKSYKNKIKQYC